MIPFGGLILARQTRYIPITMFGKGGLLAIERLPEFALMTPFLIKIYSDCMSYLNDYLETNFSQALPRYPTSMRT